MTSRKKSPNAKHVYGNYVRRCRTRNMFWELNLAQFERLTKSNCVYCGIEPKQNYRGYIYNGLDRKENKLGYTVSNTVPACGDCNAVKSDRFTFAQMKQIGRIISVLNKAEKKLRARK